MAAPPATLTRDGTYQVGTQLAPGTYVASSAAGCYWERRDRTGTSLAGIIANDFRYDDGRVIVTVERADKYFVTDGCGSWTRLMPRGAQVTSFGDGTHAVGIHIRPGTYRTSGSSEDYCYWEISTNFSGELDAIIENDFTDGAGWKYVTFYSGEAFTSSGCGTWKRVS